MLVQEEFEGFERHGAGDEDFVQGMAGGSGAKKTRHNCYNQGCTGMRNEQRGCEGERKIWGQL